jgi:hypothetical protein
MTGDFSRKPATRNPAKRDVCQATHELKESNEHNTLKRPETSKRHPLSSLNG